MSPRYEIAKEIAKKAGELVLEFYNKNNYSVSLKEGDENYLTDADIKTEQLIINEIKMKFPEDGIIAEESANGKKLENKYVWIIDPIDGTRGFVNRNGQFSIHIGIIKENIPIIGVVHCPTSKRLYSAEKGNGAYLNDKKIEVSNRNKIENLHAAIHSRKNDFQTLHLYRKLPYSSEEAMGGSGNKICLIAQGVKDLLISCEHKVCEWDLCAPHVILVEAGGMITFNDGSQVNYNRGINNYDKPIIISNGKCHESILEKIRS